MIRNFEIDFNEKYFIVYRLEIQWESLLNRMKTPKDKELFILFCLQVVNENINKFGGKGFVLLNKQLGSSRYSLESVQDRSAVQASCFIEERASGLWNMSTSFESKKRPNIFENPSC